MFWSKVFTCSLTFNCSPEWIISIMADGRIFSTSYKSILVIKSWNKKHFFSSFAKVKNVFRPKEPNLNQIKCPNFHILYPAWTYRKWDMAIGYKESETFLNDVLRLLIFQGCIFFRITFPPRGDFWWNFFILFDTFNPKNHLFSRIQRKTPNIFFALRHATIYNFWEK